MARRTLTDTTIAALKPKAERYTVSDPGLPGHYVRVTPTGTKTFVCVARAPSSKQIWHTVGDARLYKLAEARELAREAIKAIKLGESHASPKSFAAVSDDWFQRHVVKKGLRSSGRVRSYLDRHILPAWGDREFTSIRRGDVAQLLDGVEDRAGAVAADTALSIVQSITTWYTARHEDYVSPVVKGMRRSNPSERARKRILSDDELRAVWQAASENGTYGAMVRVLLLTGQRREKVATMRWDDITEDGTWRIRSEEREKGNADELPLPQAALDIIKAQPRYASNPFVFATGGRGHYSTFDRGKTELDAKIGLRNTTFAPWRLHDLRRTARSLMSRAGVRPDIAERVLGHAIRGVEGIYDRHEYRDEKAHALRALAALIENILEPPAEKVRQLRG